jgi:hypothetical protein
LKIETDPGTQFTLMAALADLGSAEGERQLRTRMEAMEENSLWNSAHGGAGESRSVGRIARQLLVRYGKK